MIDQNKNIYVSYWLLLITFLVGIMICVGGLTRLTDSGLSITNWDLISGIIPPLSLADWEYYFSLYKQIPEFKLQNSTMTLSEFKIIYWWEYFHRLLGRIIGIFYLLPLIYFTYKKYLPKDLLVSYYFVLILICFQGFMGWYMVKSGLTENTDVSHYRLATHLTLAFIIFIFLMWNYLKIKEKKSFIKNKRLPIYLPIIFTFLILMQIGLGALVSGLDAGQIYNSWPLMNGNFFPNDSNLRDLFTLAAFETASILQFIHRKLAYLILLLFLYIFILIYKNKDFSHLKNIAKIIFFILLIQVFLGIFTILSGAQIVLASMHQIGSIFLISASVIFVYKNSRN